MKPKILTTLRTYSTALFLADIVAGVTVAAVAIPLSIAIAVASGADPAKGLVTAIVGGFLISLLGGSRVQIGGPTGAFIVVVYGVVANHGYDGLVLATLMAGVILIVAGLLRLGNLVKYVPQPVVNGFTVGIGILIATSQLKDMFGLQMVAIPVKFTEKIAALWAARDSFNGAAFLIGTVTLGLIVVLRRLLPRFLALIIAVLATSAFVHLNGLAVETLYARFGAFPNRLPMPDLPVFSKASMMKLVPSSLVIAFLAAVQSLLSARAADQIIGGHHRPHAELIAQGLANIGSALFGGMPVAGAIARTVTNANAGGKTPVAGLVHAMVILAVMMLAAPLAGYMAMPALAGLLILIAWNMTEPHKWRGYMQGSVSDRVLLILTLVLTVVVDLTVAIGVGVSLGWVLRRCKTTKSPKDRSPPAR